MESIKLNLIPGSVLPVVHVSQYDIGRKFKCYLFDGSSEYTLSNESITIYVRKPDGKLVTESVAATSGAKYVEISTTQQMDAVAGKNVCELKISKDATLIGTCNFYMEVERDPTDGAIASESEIHDLQAQVDADVQEYLSHYASEAIGFDPTGTDLESTNVEDAIKEVNQKVNDIPDPTADNVEFDNDGTDLASTNVEDVIKEVNTKVNNLPSPMVYKGTVGDSGTVEWANLPAPSSSGQSKNIGFTYKVITDHGTAPICEAGDVIVSDGTEWTVVPSGDEPSGTVTNIATGAGLTGGPITSTGTIKANLRSETPLTRDSAAATEEADRVFAVVLDKSGKLAVVVPAGADIDDAHTSDRKTWSSEKISGELDKKADTEGVYDDFTAGSAKQLVSSVGEEDTSPYLFRTAGGSVDIGDRADVRALTGGTVAFNQLFDDSNIRERDNYGVKIEKNSNGSIKFSGTATNNTSLDFLTNAISLGASHKYLLKFSNLSLTIKLNNGGVVTYVDASNRNQIVIFSNNSLMLSLPITSSNSYDNDNVFINIIDLTQMFGSTIADYIYSLEQGTAGAGVAWFKKLFPKDYYAYNAGELISVKTSARITTGFNQFNRSTITANSWIDDVNGTVAQHSGYNVSDFIKVIPNTVYYKTGSNSGRSLYYDASGVVLPNQEWNAIPSGSSTFTTPANAHYVRFTITDAYLDSFCINLHWDGERDGEHESYVKHEYPLDPNLELRGIPKLDSANKLIYDGDTYEPDGRVTRKYGIVDLGTLTYTGYTYGGVQGWYAANIVSQIARPKANGKLVCPIYVQPVNDQVFNSDGVDFEIYIPTENLLKIKNSKYSDAATFKTAMSGVYLVYELATPTTESAEPYTTPQVVDDWGTEEFADNRTIPLLVGHDTVYQINLRAKLEMAPNSPDDEGDYLMRHVDGQNEYVPYVPVDISGKADTDGEYAELKAGNLVPTTYEEDEVPYLFRTSGGAIDIGEQEEDMLVGGTVAFNQLVQNGNFDDSSTWVPKNGTLTVSNNVGIYTVTTKSSAARIEQVVNVIKNHYYLITATVKNNTSDYIRFSLKPKTGSYLIGQKAINSGEQNTFTQIAQASDDSNDVMYFYVATNADDVQLNETAEYSKITIFDLTQMFGSTIADYIYNLEQSTAGAGVAWFRNIFPKDYYAYNVGELMSVKATKHIMTGFNAWDEEWEVGAYSTDTGNKVSSANRIRSKNYIPVIPNTAYYRKYAGSGVFQIYTYDSNKQFLGQLDYNSAVFLTPSGCHYITFNTGANSGATYNNDICINLSWDGERDGEYEPYVKYEYPLDSNLELRGIPKLDANNKLYYDGDTYESDGTVTRKYGIVDLGSLNWRLDGDGGKFFDSSLPLYLWGSGSSAANPKAICSKYAATPTYPINDKCWGMSGGGYFEIYDASFAGQTAATFKTAMSGVYLVYELATPTTEEADPFTNPQKVNDFGTEEYEDNRTVPIPVGHYTKYPPNLRAKLEMAPDSPSGDGDYIVRQSNGENSYVLLTKELPTPPSSNGTYVLKCTKSGSSVTYSWVAET